MDEVIIRPLSSVADFRAMQQLEQTVWENEPPTPVNHTITVAKNGGVVLGAWLDQQLVGMLYSFPGFFNNQIYLCSHSLAVRQELRSLGIGEKLKRAQAEAALAMGYRMMTWTYDPLLTPNGYLNVGKLGVICSTYLENCYGEMNDPMNKGLPTDRFKVEWWLDRPRLALPQGRSASLLDWYVNDRGLPVPGRLQEDVAGASLLRVAVPAYYQDIKNKDLALAGEWRLCTRQIFLNIFAAGWAVAGFCLRRGEPVHEYVLAPRAALNIPPAPWQEGEQP
ncbi:GNAT family N-acetyltransferase [Desulforamulus hydrothermalis]|uniref:N-acetyltransferase domain-containing protein n=1 Tax=Desulforamulus hydrothermalis Lam5 = DSM 18033 TaxID=1121428 RepID=K8E7P5_9FIRM|nr:GNAT family N-acetyltransferase [Desulforamulus hydrothermalis]CCO07538.1 conserved hypothetical protein [Desulforamulus hydrothermalis Lam5 = DSM 18033]SHH30904.1 Predicted acetyltransferase, GNAT superfamily [Desulforamulus hydrothermalis Lam5 = DSM 18033]